VQSLGSAHILQSDIDDQMIKRTMPGICDATHPKCSVCYLWKDCQDGYLMFSYPEFSSCSTALQHEAWSKRDLQSNSFGERQSRSCSSVEGTMFGSVATTAMSPKNFLDHLLTLFRSSLATSTPLRWSFYILQQIGAYLQSGI